MAEFPIVPSKTAMLFFDTLNIYLHPENPESATAVEASGVVPAMMKMYDACRSGKPGVDEFFMTQIFPVFARVMTVDKTIAMIEQAAAVPA